MRRIIRNRSAEVCPSGFIWLVWVSIKLDSTANYQITKIIYPEGTRYNDILSTVSGQATQIIQITEVNI